MAGLTINGWTCPVAAESASEGVEDIGDEGRSFDGTLLNTLRATKSSLEVTTIPLAAATVLPLMALLKGDGHVWSFDDSTYFVYSSKGLNKASGTGTSITGKFSNGMRLSAGATMTWSVGASSTWTLMVWRYNSFTTTWIHWILCSDGTKYQNGAVYGSSIPFLAFSSGTLTLGDSGSIANQDFDGLVFLPAVVTAEMALAFGTATAAFGLLPRLLLGGDLILEGARTAKARVEGVEVTQGMDSGSFVPLRAVSASFEEI